MFADAAVEERPPSFCILRRLHRCCRDNKNGTDSEVWFGLTQFAHLTPHEFTDIYLRPIMSTPVGANLTTGEAPTASNKAYTYPSYGDWSYGAFSSGTSTYGPGYVSPPRNQGKCGGCWAYSQVGQVVTRKIGIGGAECTWSSWRAAGAREASNRQCGVLGEPTQLPLNTCSEQKEGCF